jgi:hypothetical protein
MTAGTRVDDDLRLPGPRPAGNRCVHRRGGFVRGET